MALSLFPFLSLSFFSVVVYGKHDCTGDNAGRVKRHVNSSHLSAVFCIHNAARSVNIFILNLAVGDLMVCFVSMPSHVLLLVFGQWILGQVACKLTGYGYVASVAVTTFLLTAMSLDRYQVRPISFLCHCCVFYRQIVPKLFRTTR